MWICLKLLTSYVTKNLHANGSRQDIIAMGAVSIYWERIFKVEFLDDYLRIKDNTNILQQNMFTILTSIEIIATYRFFAILHVAICMPFWWLTGNNHKLSHQNWSARSMSCEIGILQTACNDLIDYPSLINDKSFMMHTYDSLMDELPESKYYIYCQL